MISQEKEEEYENDVRNIYEIEDFFTDWVSSKDEEWQEVEGVLR